MSLAESVAETVEKIGLYYADSSRVANAMGIPVNSLFGVLRDEGTTFQAVKNQVRVKLLDVATENYRDRVFLLGFSRPQGFYRWRKQQIERGLIDE